ncbi:alpha/beta fold hydrolase [Amycolatopsis solani]|uniref:alpha/beta fold hydrolase n=1 Tax=Amycolatopsis solani TaxID=3028615 RepID=UPI0025B087BA|nr:alpha/beta hydrolase [Amycolatopsis sp. MEP2-6]
MTTASRLRDPSAGHRFVASDGAALHVVASGPADSAVTLVLVHGWTQDHRTWDYVLPHLDPGVRVLRYDLRGHGGSAHARPGSATIARLADDLAELIADRVPIGPLVLAGHSMGGMTLMVLAERHPSLVRERLAGAAFVATSSGDMDQLTLGFPGLVGRGVTRFEPRVARLLARLRSDTLRLRPGVVRSGARRLVFGVRPGRAQVDSVVEQLLCAHPASAGLFLDAIASHRGVGGLGALCDVPSVVLAGERDRLCPLAHAKVIADELPHAEFVRYPGAGHMLPQERPFEVARRLSALIRVATAVT